MASDTPEPHRALSEGGEDAGTASSGSGRSSRELRVEAPAFVPPAQVCDDASALVFNRDESQLNSTKRARQDGLKPVRTIRDGRRNLYESLDAVPFTPSQGICTPTPHSLVGGRPSGKGLWSSPRPALDPRRSASTPRSPGSAKQRARWSGGPRGSTPHSGRPPVIDEMPPIFAPNGAPPMQPGYMPPTHYPPLLFSSFYYSGFHPLSPQGQPVSPMAFYPPPQHAFDMAAAAAPYGPPSPMAPTGFPTSPHAPYPMHGAAWAPAMAAAPYPAMGIPPQMVPGGDAVDAIMYHKQHASGSTVGDGTVGGSHESDASHEESLCDQGGGQGMALDFAALLQQAQHVHLPPPQELIDLVALLTSYGVLHEVSPLLQYASPAAEATAHAAAAATDPAPSSNKKGVNKFRHPPRFAVDGTLILNARQRRTLRRAQDRAARAVAAILHRPDGDDTSGASVHSRQASSDSGGGNHPCRPPAEVMLLQALPGTTLAHVAAMVASHLPQLAAPTPPQGVPQASVHPSKARGSSRFAPGEGGHHQHSHSQAHHHDDDHHANGDRGSGAVHHVRAASEGIPKRLGGDALQVWATAAAW